MQANQIHNAFGEVIESSLERFTVQCWEWNTGPSFGSLVYTMHNTTAIMGIVSEITTGSMDPVRYPFPYKKSEEELREEHPHIFEFLKTNVTILCLGYQVEETSHYLLPKKPASIHGFVYEASFSHIASFFKHPEFLSLLFYSAISEQHRDELFLSILSLLAQHNLLTLSSFEAYYHHYSLLIGNDYRRLKTLLQRISHLYAPYFSL